MSSPVGRAIAATILKSGIQDFIEYRNGEPFVWRNGICYATDNKTVNRFT